MATYLGCQVIELDFRTTSFGRQVQITGVRQSGSKPTVTRWLKVPGNVEVPLVLAKFQNRSVNAIATTGSGSAETIYQIIVL